MISPTNSLTRSNLFFKTIVSLTFFASLSCTQIAFAQNETKAENTKTNFSDFAKHIPSSHSEIAATSDVGKAVKAMLTSEYFERINEAFSTFQNAFGGADLEESLDENMRYFPTALAVSADKTIYKFMADIFRILLISNTGIDSLAMDDFYEDEMEKLESELGILLKDFQIPQSTIWIGMREESAVDEVFAMARGFMGNLEAQFGIEIQEGRDSFSINTINRDILPNSMLQEFVEGNGFADKGNAISNSLANIELKIKFQKFEDGILVQLGEPATKFGKDIKHLDGFIDEPNQLAWTQWNGEAFASAMNDVQATMESLSKTELGQNSIKLDTQDFWESARSVVKTSEDFGASGHARVWTENGQGHCLTVQTGMQPAKTLAQDPILKWVPPDIAAYAISSKYSMADSLFSMLEEMEENLAKEALKDEFSSPDQFASPYDAIIDSYYENFGEMRRLIRDDWRQIPAVPSLLVADMTGDSCRWIMNATNDDMRIEHRFDSFVRMASISKPDDIDALENIHTKVFESFAKGVFALNDMEKPADWEATKRLRLDDGTLAMQFNLDWVKELNDYTIRFDGDWQPHMFSRDGYHVFSTSIALSNQLLANKTALRIPNQQGKQLVHVGRVKLEAGGKLYKELLNFIFSAIDQSMGGGVNGDEMMDEFGNFFLSVFTNLGEFTWEAWQEGDVLERRYVIDPAARGK